MARKSFSIHADYYEELSNLTNEQRGVLMMVLINWAEDKEVTCSAPMCAMLFRLMISQIERISQANSSNGSKGGRPAKTEKSEITEAKRIKPTVTNTVTLSDTNTNTIIGADAPATTTDLEDVQIKNKQIKQGKNGKIALSADEYSKLLSEFGEPTVSNYITIVDAWANTLPQGNKIKSSDKVIRKAIAEQWDCNNAKKNTDTKITRTDADYAMPFIRRYKNE